jgi:hypothetical protein
MLNFVIKKEDMINEIMIGTLLLQVFVLKWFNLSVYAGYIFDILMLISISAFYKKYDLKMLIIIFDIGIYFAINFIINKGSLKDLISNFRYLLQPMLLIAYTAYLAENSLIKKECIKNMIKPLNVYMILNLIVISFQIKGYAWTAGLGYSGFQKFTTFEDSISGLFGVYGVPIWGMFSIFIFLFNHVYFNNYSEKKDRAKLNVYNFGLLLCAVVVSTINDNKIFFLFLPTFLSIFFINQIFGKNTYASRPVKTVRQFFIIIICNLLVLVIAYCFIDRFVLIINSMANSIMQSLDYKNAGNNGSGERIAIILYFFNELDTIFGYGLGKGRWTQKGLLGYKHFGISDFGTILCLGGIILFILIYAIFYFLYTKLFKRKLKVIIFIFMTALVMFCTQIVYNTSGMLLYMLICLVFYWQEKLNIDNLG